MSRRRRGGGEKAPNPELLWGTTPEDPEPPRPIVPAADRTALLRSLGPSPLAPDKRAEESPLGVVYEEAVKAAIALAAVNGLLAGPDDFG